MPRCPWAAKPQIYIDYHDEEWGVPLFEDQRLFEFLTLEAFQAGLSWLIILNKREAFRQAFSGFDPKKIARFSPKKIAALLGDPGIVRNRLKVEAAVTNARAFLEVQAACGSFARYIWGFVDGQPLVNHFSELAAIPAKTSLATAISKDLKRRGFRFVGPTVVYSHMQATGMVNDHLVDCPRHGAVQRLPRLPL